jgi:chromosomal replication initiation ATPase DnaA
VTPPRQLTLDWPHAPSFAREDFLSAPSNRDALAAIDRWPDWPSRMLLLVGPEGAGKSHLAAIWAQRSGAVLIRGESLAAPDFTPSGEAGALRVEDADRVGDDEDRLFHLVNGAIASGAWLLITARSAPDAWALKTPDLLSRLRLAPMLRIGAPDDELMQAVLFKLFSDRQLQVEPHVAAYVAARIERSIGAARAFVAAVDRETLSRGRRLTRALAGEILRATEPD